MEKKEKVYMESWTPKSNNEKESIENYYYKVKNFKGETKLLDRRYYKPAKKSIKLKTLKRLITTKTYAKLPLFVHSYENKSLCEMFVLK